MRRPDNAMNMHNFLYVNFKKLQASKFFRQEKLVFASSRLSSHFREYVAFFNLLLNSGYFLSEEVQIQYFTCT